MKVELRRAALEDLEAGSAFYDEFGAGLGAYFLESVFADIRALEQFAGIHERRGKYFRARTRHFPFGIFYRVSGDLVEVAAVFDCRRSPRWILKRLRERGQ